MQLSNHPVLTALNTYHVCLHRDSICTSLFMMCYRHTLFTFNTASHCMYPKPYIAISAPNWTLGRFSCLLRHKSCSVQRGIHSLLPFLISSSLFMLLLLSLLLDTVIAYCTTCLQQTPLLPPWGPSRADFCETPEAWTSFYTLGKREENTFPHACKITFPSVY